MDFVVGLPCSQAGHDAIWVIVDKLTKSAHFIPFQITWSTKKLAHVYLDEIVWLQKVPRSIDQVIEIRILYPSFVGAFMRP